MSFTKESRVKSKSVKDKKSPKFIDPKFIEPRLRRGCKNPPPESEDDDVFDSEEDEESEWTDDDEKETTDSSYVPKKSYKKRIITSDSESEESEEPKEKMSPKKFKELLNKLYPSKYMKSKLAKEDEDEEPLKKRSSKKSIKKASKNRQEESEEEESESEDSEEEESEDSEEEDEDYETADEEEDEKKAKYNIVLNMGGGGDYEYEDADQVIEEDDKYDSDDEKNFMKDTYENVVIPLTIDTSFNKSSGKKGKKHTKLTRKEESDELDKKSEEIEQKYIELLDLKKMLTSKLVKTPKNKILRHAVDECGESIQKLVTKHRMKNTKKYIELMNGSNTKQSEADYFRKHMSNKEQLRAMKELAEINTHIYTEKPYRLTMLESNIPSVYKATVMQKLNILKTMEPGDPEYYKIKNWVDTFMRVPFGVYKNLSVTMADGLDICSDYMVNAKKILDDCVYGLDDAKLQVLQMVGQWIANPAAMGTSIAICGPMGTGKTSLIKDGISKLLGREFAFIALGGASDSSFLEGHSYTYEGSLWGKIVQTLIDSKCMNPVFYFDELDKVSATPKGDEIIGILTHLTDTTQNSCFHDKYFSEIDFDLSKCLFIFSYNDESLINPILKDRMYRIQTKGYETAEKLIIARKYLLPKIREQVNFGEDEIIIPDDTLKYIITNKKLTHEEAGVRNLKRCLEIIYTKLNLFRLVKSDTKIFGKDLDLDIKFPYTVERKDVDIFIKNDEKQNQSILAMYV
jgi:ATP-dependent Lon protease